MDGKSLGIIETKGFVAAVEAADAAAKSANVTFFGCQYVGAGLVSILMTGDVGSVKASMDAAKSAAQRLGEVKSVTVIARTAQGLETIIENQSISDKTAEPKVEISLDKPSGASTCLDSELPEYEKDELEKLTVQKLRSLARKIKNFPIAKDKIKFSRKKNLIKAMLNHHKQDKE